MKRILTVLVICILGLNAYAQTEETVDISGVWVMTSETPRGKKVSELTITQEGNQAIAKVKKQEFAITIEGNKLSWKQKVSTPMGKMTTENEGIVENDNMEGTMSMVNGPMSGKKMKWTAIRKIEKE